MQIEDLLKLVVEKFPCTENEYPEMQVLDETGKRRFERSHALAHVMKSLGRVAAQLETIDHGVPANKDATQSRICKLMADVMRLAAAFDLTDEDIKEYFESLSRRPR